MRTRKPLGDLNCGRRKAHAAVAQAALPSLEKETRNWAHIRTHARMSVLRFVLECHIFSLKWASDVHFAFRYESISVWGIPYFMSRVEGKDNLFS